MSTQTRLQPSRRTVLRSAAWTMPAVSIAVASPAFATHSDIAPTGTASNSGSTRSAKQLDLKSTLTAGPRPLAGVTATVTLTSGQAIGTASPVGNWTPGTPSGTSVTYTYSGSVVAGQALAFNPVITLANDPGAASVSANVAFGWTNGAGASTVITLAGPAATITNSTAVRTAVDGSAGVRWTFTIAAGGTTALADLKLDFAFDGDLKKPTTVFRVRSNNTPWTITSARPQFLASWGGTTVAGGQTLTVVAEFANGDNSVGDVSVVVSSGTTPAGSATARYQDNV